MEELFWSVLNHFQNRLGFFGRRYAKLPRRFKKTIHAIDSTTIALVANCMSRAKHRRRKAAAKCHLRLNLGTFLPGFAIVEEASHHDDTRARRLCAGLREGEIALFDKACVNFAHLFELSERGVFRVARAKDNMSFRVRKKLLRKPKGKVLRDDIVSLKAAKSKKGYPESLRRVVMLVEINGKEVEMAFVTNNFEWAPGSVGALYQARRGIEVFFKQIKQTLMVCDFPGHSKHAIRWQLWSALLLYVLLRFLGQTGNRPHSFTRLYTMIRGVVRDRCDLFGLLRFYGTAGSRWRMRATPETAYLPGFSP
jgi:hypothetical protein